MRHKDFLGFRFGKIHTSDLNLEVVSTSNRYEPRILPAPSDTTMDIPGSDGQYYLGSNFKNREITCNVAFNNVSEKDYRKIRQLFASDKLQDLVFDEEPYKTWRAKIKSKPEFKSLCFTDKETGERVYKGEGKLVFICYFPYAFGFDKYIVRAADYYLLNPPECIITEAESDNTFVKSSKQKNPPFLPQDIKYHYNSNPSDYEGGNTKNNIDTWRFRDKMHRNLGERELKPNGPTSWKTGFPDIAQVQAGELFFDTEEGQKSIVDVRGYWDNIPEWQSTAKLLTTPTLDFDQELIYLPQFSKTNYINMETGFDSGSPLIGSRLLVYNPGDLPVDWELRFDENKRGFWSTRGGTKFRIRRFNVERLPIDCAVDWCGLTTYDPADNEKFKYGNKYFKRRNIFAKNETTGEDIFDKIKILVDQNYKIYRPVEMEESNFYTREPLKTDEICNLVRRGIIPTDKGMEAPYSIKYNWQEIYKRKEDESVFYNKFKNFNDSHLTTPTYSRSFDLKLDISHFNDLDQDSYQGWAFPLYQTTIPRGLGKAHPHHCYYVEPIPREKLANFIKLFYWQTIQWRGDLTVDGRFINMDKWKEMLPKEFFNQEKLEQGIYIPANMENPLISFLSNFINFATDGTMSIKQDSLATRLREAYRELDFEDGIILANEYEELYNECVDELEQYELYWKTLKKLLYKFEPIFRVMLYEEEHHDGGRVYFKKFDDEPEQETGILSAVKTIQGWVDLFVDQYINQPLEYIGSDSRELNYGEYIFNGYKMPEWITDDYMEIDQFELSNVQLLMEYLTAIGEDKDAIFTGRMMYYTPEDRARLEEKGSYSSLIKKMDNLLGTNGCLNDLLDDYYYLNSDTRMLYTTQNPYGAEFVYAPKKKIMNEAITQGKWFKLPPGWSLISIEPIIDETLWGGKRWEDARPFDWGYSGDVRNLKRESQQLFDFIMFEVKKEFFSLYPIETLKDCSVMREYYKEYSLPNYQQAGEETQDEEFLKFKIWYEKFLEIFPAEENYFANEFYKKLRINAEYTFLKLINDYWNQLSPFFKWTSQRGVYIEPRRENMDNNGNIKETAWPTDVDYDVCGLPLRNINGDISDWWWYATNYLWSNFPPPYWACADMLNKIKIKYTPLFY